MKCKEFLKILIMSNFSPNVDTKTMMITSDVTETEIVATQELIEENLTNAE